MAKSADKIAEELRAEALMTINEIHAKLDYLEQLLEGIHALAEPPGATT